MGYFFLMEGYCKEFKIETVSVGTYSAWGNWNETAERPIPTPTIQFIKAFELISVKNIGGGSFSVVYGDKALGFSRPQSVSSYNASVEIRYQWSGYLN